MAKTYTAAGSATAGQVYTASAHNVIVTDVNNLIAPAFCVLTAFNGSQNFASGVGSTVQFNGADTYDTDAMHDTVTNNTRVIAQTEGLYACTFYAIINSTAVTQFLVSLLVNGGEFAQSASPVSASAARASTSGLIYLTAGQYVEAAVYQESTGGVSRNLLTARLSVAWIGRT